MLLKAAHPLAILLGLVFLTSGIAKLLDVAAFGAFIESFALGPIVTFLAPLVPVFEIALGIALLNPSTRKTAALVAIIALAGFTLLFFYGRFFGFVQTCQCFGSLTKGEGPGLLVLRNGLLAAMAFVAWRGIEAQPLGVSTGFLGFSCLMVAIGMLAVFSHFKPIVKNTALKVGSDISTTSIAPHLGGGGNYVLFFYNTGCISCVDAVANVKEYARDGSQGEVVGFTIGEQANFDQFAKLTDLNFKNVLLPIPELLTYVKTIPTVYYVRDNKVVLIETGRISAPLNLSFELKPLKR